MQSDVFEKELVITRGLPASNKTGWTRKQLAEGKATSHVSRDDLRRTLFMLEGNGTPAQEMEITRIQKLMVSNLLRRRSVVIVDDTFLRNSSVLEFHQLAMQHGANFRIQDFPVDVDECIRRDALRERPVGADVIKGMSKRYMNGGSTLPTLPAEVYSQSVYQETYQEDYSLPHAWIFDIDGTLADMKDYRGPFEWAKVGLDDPIISTINLLKTLHENGKKIILLSGRSDVCRQETIEWMELYEVPFDLLLMRPAAQESVKDFRIKNAFFEDEIRGHYYVEGIVDDRLQVVRLWYSKGLPVYRVGDPEANF